MKSKKALIVLFMAILMVSVVNISTKNSSQSRTILFEDSIRNINPVNTTGQIWAMLFNQIFERPFTFRKDGELVPQLVEDWNVNKDYTSFTFKFLKGVKFHNGKEMIADDIIYSINYIKKNTREEERLIFENIQNITRIDDFDNSY
jgi:peptide/nickel transport system substrate-binding protein